MPQLASFNTGAPPPPLRRLRSPSSPLLASCRPGALSALSRLPTAVCSSRLQPYRHGQSAFCVSPPTPLTAAKHPTDAPTPASLPPSCRASGRLAEEQQENTEATDADLLRRANPFLAKLLSAHLAGDKAAERVAGADGYCAVWVAGEGGTGDVSGAFGDMAWHLRQHLWVDGMLSVTVESCCSRWRMLPLAVLHCMARLLTTHHLRPPTPKPPPHH